MGLAARANRLEIVFQGNNWLWKKLQKNSRSRILVQFTWDFVIERSSHRCQLLFTESIDDARKHLCKISTSSFIAATFPRNLRCAKTCANKKKKKKETKRGRECKDRGEEQWVKHRHVCFFFWHIGASRQQKGARLDAVAFLDSTGRPHATRCNTN